jgi:hypothetical protein
MASVPGFQGTQVQPDLTQIGATNTISSGAQINNQLTQGLGQLNSNWQNETAPQLNSGIAAAGDWYSGSRKVAQGNAQRHFLDAGADMISSANNALSTLYQNQGLAALGLVIA